MYTSINTGSQDSTQLSSVIRCRILKVSETSKTKIQKKKKVNNNKINLMPKLKFHVQNGIFVQKTKHKCRQYLITATDMKFL